NSVFPQIKKRRKSNLIIVPVLINGVELNFLVDTGVSFTLIFDNHKAKQLGLSTDQPYMLRGLGNQPALEAFKVTLANMRIGDLTFVNQDALVLPENEFELSRRMGTQIDGIIGYDLFSDYPVLIDYQRKFMQINPSSLSRRWRSAKVLHFPMRFHRKKPHIELFIPQSTKNLVQGELMLDSGLSDAIWLFPNVNNIVQSSPVFEDFLGTGINGDVFGQRGKLPQFHLGSQVLKDVKVAYPKVDSIQAIPLADNRIGSIGAELLSRFKVFIDYPNAKISLMPTRQTHKPFYYNLSGLEIEYDGMRMIKQKVSNVQRGEESQNRGIEILLHNRFELILYPSMTISYVRPNSPAHIAGLREGDVLLQINGKKAYNMPLERVLGVLQKEPGERIKLIVERKKVKMKFNFTLQSFFDTITPSP
ncbi:aspartyl protease family protein, partial [Flavobacteriaceae bacterium]|nr:aspartyl protease family protein [Flavobacteriaceae bacterium]